jgi:hypothetical protein
VEKPTDAEVGRMLGALASGAEKRSDAARLRSIRQQVEDAIAAGVSHSAIHEMLVANGFSFTLGSFRAALYRVRKKNKAPALAPSAPSVGQPPAPRPTPTQQEVNTTATDIKLSSKQLRQRLADEYVSEAALNPVLRKKTT